MSARSQRGIHDTATTKRFRSPRITVKNRVVKPQITYDYDAAVSQPDIPNLLNNKKIGRSTMVSGLPLKKRALKNRLKGRIMSSKNFQKRSQEYKTKSLVQKNKKTRSLDSENANPTRKTIISSSFFKKEDHITEKGNIDNNDIVYNEDLTNLRNLIVDGKNISSKDTTKEAIGNDDNQITEAKVKDKRSDDYESVSMRSPVQVKHSKIPRAKITTFPAHTFDEFHPTKLKTKESPQLKCLMASDATNKFVTKIKDNCSPLSMHFSYNN
ncbi:PREDICTED: uncharacterized protein LOC108546700 isoform X2 [Eufriesea mexicana]|uniref:uncharacterized protein LOC108546700 isoform X2 n=1 Tax=Eufriesea mexicana TaxID=516756 RepID=UPI00083C0FDB|nr:PREDICTED: uncharacterized protein LOC108546700 isoform X2 [Eufriesea mexicana]